MKACTWAALLLVAFAAPLGAQNAVAPSLRLGDYMDTAALRPRLAALPALEAEKRMARVFRLEFDSVGRPLRAIPAVPRAMPAHYRDAVAPLVVAAVRRVEPRRYEWGRLILVETGPAARVMEIYPPERAPRVTNTGALATALEKGAVALAKVDSTLDGKSSAARVMMQIDEEGAISSARIERSSGIAAVDEMVLRTVRVTRFAPLLLDGEPAPAQVLLPIQIIIEGGREPAKPASP